MNSSRSRARRPPAPPSGLLGHVSRREAAALLGFSSDFKVRQLEKAGRLHPQRGAMAQAWYARDEVLAVRTSMTAADAAATSPWTPAAGALEGRWTDSQLIAYLRRGRPSVAGGVDAPPTPHPTVVDLVADTGISIARADRVYRFWVAHEAACPERSRSYPAAPDPSRPSPGGDVARSPAQTCNTSAWDAAAEDTDDGRAVSRAPGPPPATALGLDAPVERRGRPRRDRDDLIRRLRDPDPSVRAAAFQKLKKSPPG